MNAQEEHNLSLKKTEEILEKYLDHINSKIGARHRYVAENTPELDDNDYAIYYYSAQFPNHFIEIKTRRCLRKDFETTIVPLRKHSTAEHYYRSMGIRTYYIVLFNDGELAGLDLTKEPDNICKILRKDRGLCGTHAEYKTSRFKTIKYI